MNIEAFVKELEKQLKGRLNATPESPVVGPLFDVYMAVMAARKAAESPHNHSPKVLDYLTSQ